MLDFVIIGAQKSASTWLTKSIGLHPEIALPEIEFPCFEHEWPMTCDLLSLSPIYASVRNNKIAGIKNNNLLFKPEAPALLHAYNQDMKLIAVLRNPVERAISSYYWHMWVSMIPILPLNDGLKKLSLKKLIDFGTWILWKTVAAFFEYFPRKNILVISYEDIASDRLSELNRALNFLGKENTIEPSKVDFTSKQSIYNLKRIRWNSLRNKYIYKQSPDIYRKLWIHDSERSVFSNLVNIFTVAVDRLILERFLPNEKPLISTEIRASLEEIYQEDSLLLESLLEKF